jgi:hypothetical protein
MTPNDDAHDQELLARYRQASETDAVAPSAAVRAAILAESRRVAEDLAKRAPPHTFDISRPAANDSRWKITAFGTAGAAVLAALLFAPHYWENAPPAQVRAPPPAATSMAAQDQKAEASKLQEDKSYAANTAAARQAPSESDSLQERVVTQADRKSAKSYAAPSPQFAAPAATPPPSVAQNYAPVSPSAPPARLRSSDLSAGAAEGSASLIGGHPAAADSARAGSALKPATLQSAVAQGDLAQAASLLDQGAVIDAQDEAGRTPLMLAVTEDKIELVRLLLARGADPNAADHTGHTPLQQATKRNLRDIAALLEQAGAH